MPRARQLSLPPRRRCRNASAVLGATGSIGASTLDLVSRNPHAYKIVALTAQSNVAQACGACRHHGAEIAVIGDETRYGELREPSSGTGIRAAAGRGALVEAASEPADCVMAAIVGAAGLEPTFAAVARVGALALANKECLVSAGDVFMEAVRKSGAELLPVDSEHSAGFQALGANAAGDDREDHPDGFGRAFPQLDARADRAGDARAGAETSQLVDGRKNHHRFRRRMMNKGLELIEAYHLFPVEAEQLECVVHPQSIIHCLVTYRDGPCWRSFPAPTCGRRSPCLWPGLPAWKPRPSGSTS